MIQISNDACCANCTTQLDRTDTTYCSNRCQADYEWRVRKEHFEKTGIWIGSESEQSVRRRTKKYLIEVRGHRCELCKLTTWMEQAIPLILDHIDGDSSNGSLGNVRLVCGNCDMQLPTYKGKNRGKGRHSRRQRYAAGLTH